MRIGTLGHGCGHGLQVGYVEMEMIVRTQKDEVVGGYVHRTGFYDVGDCGKEI